MDKQDPTAEIEEKNRMRNTRDHFKKIRSIKGTFFKFIFFNRRIIALQDCIVFCQTST